VSERIERFRRDAFGPQAPFTVIGDGELGGKANGLASIRVALGERLGAGRLGGVEVTIPPLTVISTALFDFFMNGNDLAEIVAAELPDDRIAHAFLRAELPVELVGDLRALAGLTHRPLAVRSSSLLEDVAGQPLAGVYATKMVPNSHVDLDTRFRQLVEAVKLVWASTFFAQARAYRRVLAGTDEKMAVIVQEMAGAPHGERFYPHVSGVVRSLNYYPSGPGRPEDGVAELALGLGKWIVDGEPAWSFSPTYPKAPPPFNDIGDLLKLTQTAFWAVNLGASPYDPARETEHMLRCELAAAEEDDTLRLVASTYDPQSDRLVAGVGRQGARVIDFAPLLRHGLVPLADTVRAVTAACEDATSGPVEIELALTVDPRGLAPARCAFLQVRSLVAPGESVEIAAAELDGPGVLAASEQALGNSVVTDIRDIVYLPPERFAPDRTATIAREIEEINAALVAVGRPYLLIGFGRWGTSDPWGGVPVKWAQISGARAIVETQLEGMRPTLSQGSHFFHNMTSFRVLYLCLPHGGRFTVDWAWLQAREVVRETAHVRHVRAAAPLRIAVDGRRGLGVIRHD
jgi:hypothetical protein